MLMFLNCKYIINTYKFWAIFFRTCKIMVVESLTFEFYLKEKKATVNYCLYECKHIIMEKWTN